MTTADALGRRPVRDRLVFVTMERTDKNVSTYQIYSMEESFAKLGVRSALLQNSKLVKFIGKVLAKLKLMRRIATRDDTILIVPAWFISEYKLFPHGCVREVVPYSPDCWPDRYGDYESFYRRHGIRLAFVAARQSAEEMQRRRPGMAVVWMPEAVVAADYRPDKTLADRATDVLELGRKYDAYHNAIVGYLREAGRTHLFEAVKGRVVFPGSKRALAEGMGDAKILVNFPGSMTHPYAGDVETVTYRYFETFASKCLALGRAPQELIDLFGYNPMVEADLHAPAEQLADLLANIGDYQVLVDRNHEHLLDVGTWDVRTRQMLDHIERVFG